MRLVLVLAVDGVGFGARFGAVFGVEFDAEFGVGFGVGFGADAARKSITVHLCNVMRASHSISMAMSSRSESARLACSATMRMVVVSPAVKAGMLNSFLISLCNHSAIS